MDAHTIYNLDTLVASFSDLPLTFLRNSITRSLTPVTHLDFDTNKKSLIDKPKDVPIYEAPGCPPVYAVSKNSWRNLLRAFMVSEEMDYAQQLQDDPKIPHYHLITSEDSLTKTVMDFYTALRKLSSYSFTHMLVGANEGLILTQNSMNDAVVAGMRISALTMPDGEVLSVVGHPFIKSGTIVFLHIDGLRITLDYDYQGVKHWLGVDVDDVSKVEGTRLPDCIEVENMPKFTIMQPVRVARLQLSYVK